MFSFLTTLPAFLIFGRLISDKMQALIINTNKYNLVALFFFILFLIYVLSQQPYVSLKYQQ
jgi:hypothetical protein